MYSSFIPVPAEQVRKELENLLAELCLVCAAEQLERGKLEEL